MGRLADTCTLAGFLGASWTKPEEQATAVLASALATSDRFAHTLLEKVGGEADGTAWISTEESTGAGRDRIDLQVEWVAGDGSTTQRLWIEVKVTAELAANVDGSVDTRQPQLVRYRAALDARDSVARAGGPSTLALLVPYPPSDEDRRQAAATRSPIIVWDDVAAIAARRARELAVEPEHVVHPVLLGGWR